MSLKDASGKLSCICKTSESSFVGADINKHDDYGRTPLHIAASVDYPEMVRFLIEKGANVHARTAGEDQSPLYYASKNEAVQCVKILLAYGADIEARDYKLRTPLYVSLLSQKYLSRSILAFVRHVFVLQKFEASFTYKSKHI